MVRSKRAKKVMQFFMAARLQVLFWRECPENFYPKG
jgi:hypothetical protein